MGLAQSDIGEVPNKWNLTINSRQIRHCLRCKGAASSAACVIMSIKRTYSSGCMTPSLSNRKMRPTSRDPTKLAKDGAQSKAIRANAAPLISPSDDLRSPRMRLDLSTIVRMDVVVARSLLDCDRRGIFYVRWELSPHLAIRIGIHSTKMVYLFRISIRMLSISAPVLTWEYLKPDEI